MKTVCNEKQCVEQITKNMRASGCSEEQISEAVSNYHRLHAEKTVEIACLA